MTKIAEAAASTARMAGDERRNQILRVAEDLFSRNGFRGTTTKQIALAAGVSEAMVFRHFATKHELYSAIIDHKACASGEMDPRQWVEEAIRAKDDYAVFYGMALHAMNHHDVEPEFMRLLMYAALEEHDLANMFFTRFVMELYEFLGSYIAERQKDGAFRDVDPKVVVRAFTGMMIHHSINNNLWDKGRLLLDISNEQAAHEFATILLKGISRDRD